MNYPRVNYLVMVRFFDILLGHNILIPLKNIPEIIRIFEEFNGEISVCLSKNQISFSDNYNYVVSRLIDGIFPDYKQIIPNEVKTEAIVLKQDLLSVLKI